MLTLVLSADRHINLCVIISVADGLSEGVGDMRETRRELKDIEH